MTVLVTTKLVKIFVVVVNSDVITMSCRASQRLVEFFVVEKLFTGLDHKTLRK